MAERNEKFKKVKNEDGKDDLKLNFLEAQRNKTLRKRNVKSNPQ